MPHHDDQNNTKTGWELVKVNLALGLSKSLLVFPTQWMQVAMRRQQAALIAKEDSRVLSAKQALRELAPNASKIVSQPMQVLRSMQAAGGQVYRANPAATSFTYLNAFFKANPLYSLFKGVLPSAGKEALKNGVYKGAVIVKAPDYAETLLGLTPLNKKDYPLSYATSQAVLAGSMAASIDVMAGGALDSWATQAATSHGKEANASYTQDVLKEKSLLGKVKRAYRGFGPAVVKSGIAFTTMYGTKAPIKANVASLFELKKGENPWYATLTEATLSGTAVALVSSVPDIAKTWSQMPNPTQLSLKEAVKVNYQKHGWRGMITGVPLKSMMVISGWGLTYLVTQAGSYRSVPPASVASAAPALAASALSATSASSEVPASSIMSAALISAATSGPFFSNTAAFYQKRIAVKSEDARTQQINNPEPSRTFVSTSMPRPRI